MNFNISPCDQLEWAKNSIKMYSYSLPLENYISANILSSLQFLPEDKHLMNSQAYCLKNEENTAIAWLNIYFLSKNVIRIRGLYVDKLYRSNGHMSYLLNSVLNIYKPLAKKVVSFSRKDSLGFHKKNSFIIEPDFIPRTPVLYNPEKQIYFHDPEKEIFLMSRLLDI